MLVGSKVSQIGGWMGEWMVGQLFERHPQKRSRKADHSTSRICY